MKTADPSPPILCRDAEILAALHREAFGGEAWRAAFFRQLLEAPPVFGLVLEQGMVLAQAVAGEAEILTIGVAPRCRRQGIARLLLEASLAEAVRRGATEVFLEVAVENAAARALYRSAGFTESGRRRDYYGPGADGILLRRSLYAG